MEHTILPPTRSPRFKRLSTIAALLVIAGIVAALICHPWKKPLPDSPSFDGDSSSLKQTQFVPTLDTPLEPGKNAIWCAAFQLSWKKLQKSIAAGPVQLANANEICTRLNSAPDPTPDLPPNSFYATAGWVQKGILQTIDKEFRAAFPTATPPTFPGIPSDSFLAYAYLQVSAPFKIPYFQETNPFLFTDPTGRKLAIRAFGIRPEDASAYPELRQQVQLLYLNDSQVPEEFAIDLCRDSQAVQVVVACIKRRTNLNDTLDALETQIAAYPAKEKSTLGINDVLLVPRIQWHAIHHFRELEGKTFSNANLSGQRVDVATQEIQFKLNERGMELKAEAQIFKASAPRSYLFNRPFLLYAKTRGAAAPFFVMWIENTELLTLMNGGTASE